MQRKPLDVPEVTQLPEFSGEGENPTGFADMILTSLLAYPSAALCAEYSPGEPPISWMINPHAEELGLKEIEVAGSPNLDSFRAVLERFGSHYMNGQTRNSYAMKLLRQHDRLHECHFYLSNTEATGFWIRAYTTPVA